MKRKARGPERAAELEGLRARLAEAEEVLAAIRSGGVDALVVAGASGDQIYTLSGADRTYRQLVETMSEGAATLSEHGVILYSNGRLAEMLGRPLEQVVGSALRSYLPDADPQVLDAIVARARTAPVRAEVNLKTSEGVVVPVYLSCSRLQSEAAEATFCLVFTDLTQHKSREKIVAAELLSRRILEQSVEGIVVCDESGRIIRASEVVQGSCDGGALQRPFDEVLALRTVDGNLFQLSRVLGGETLRNIDVSRDWQGRQLAMLLNAAPLLDACQVVGCVVTLTDITERKQAEAARRESVERLRFALESCHIGAWDIDLVDHSTYRSSEHDRIFGYPERPPQWTLDDLLGHMLPEYRAEAEAFVRHPSDAGEGFNFECRIRRADGELRWVWFFARHRTSPSGHSQVIGVVRDITEERSLHEQLRQSQKLEGIGSLAGGIAHDFNNLLTVILTYTDFAIQGVRDGDPLAADLLEVKKAGERAAALTRQLLAFSRKQVLQPVSLSLNEVALGVEKMLQRILGEDIRLRHVLAPHLGLTLADPGQIEQVLMNLVVNARDAMPQGGDLTIETSNVEIDEEYPVRHPGVKPGAYVQLAVSDTGCGMDPETLARVFEPFFTTKEKGKGTGLGLSTVYGIVKQSNGDLWVQSEPGKGTVFKIYLPRHGSGAAAAVIKSRPVPGRYAGGETILLVEDEEALRRVVRRTLRAAGYTVLTAADGDEALLTSAQHAGDIALLLTDVVMPQMSGRTLVREISKTRPGMKTLYMSGYTDDAIAHHGVLEAGTNFLAKPFTGADLLRKVREVLDDTTGPVKAEFAEPVSRSAG